MKQTLQTLDIFNREQIPLMFDAGFQFGTTGFQYVQRILYFLPTIISLRLLGQVGYD